MSSKCTACLTANCVNRNLLLAGSTFNTVIWMGQGRKLKLAVQLARKPGLSGGFAIRKCDNISFNRDKRRSNTVIQDKLLLGGGWVTPGSTRPLGDQGPTAGSGSFGFTDPILHLVNSEKRLKLPRFPLQPFLLSHISPAVLSRLWRNQRGSG